MDVKAIIDRFPFFTGVPDSQLKALCNGLMSRFGIGAEHIIAANEGNCTALAAGYHLATGKVPVVYMQNSGIGNIINPVASLLNDKVYAIPCLFVVGWRGEPGIHDEPQHIYQGMVTETLLRDMDIDTFILDKETTDEEFSAKLDAWQERFEKGLCCAVIVRKGALQCADKVKYQNDYAMVREDIIRTVTDYAEDDVIVSTTGKASRELFEIREAKGQGHERDFLTVGSMGHASSIALGVALNKPHTRVWCIDGDGAALMHMGSMAVIGANRPANLIHIVINNAAHETVGGMTTVAGQIDLPAIAKACGYPRAIRAGNEQELHAALREAVGAGELTLIEARACISSRDDLGRPTTTALENKQAFMTYLATLD